MYVAPMVREWTWSTDGSDKGRVDGGGQGS
jgi:hypothetical protein